jgi:type IV pilus assembly protein PilX
MTTRASFANRRSIPRVRARERGVVLMIALIVLVAMTLAGLGIIRSVDSGTLVAGNIGYRQAALASTDAALETAITWLVANKNTLNVDIPGSGFYSTRQDALDITGNKTAGGTDGVDWYNANPLIPVKAVHVGTDASGSDLYYIINRLCSIPGGMNDPGQDCTTTTGTGIGSTQGSPAYGQQGLPEQDQPYYRVTVRADGLKNTVTYVQAMVTLGN